VISHPAKPPAHSAKPFAKPAPKHAEKASVSGKPPAQPSVEPDVAEPPVLRVPFGRGPKDKAFRQEQQAAQDQRNKHRRRR
jgi:hypothetical protein